MLEIILLAVFSLLGLTITVLFLNKVFQKKTIEGSAPLVFDIAKYLLVALLITISIKYESVIGVIIFTLSGFGVFYLGTKGK